MLKKTLFLSLIIFLAACTSSRIAKNTVTSNSLIQAYIDTITKQYAPDKRTALFALNTNGNVISGETNMPAAKADLIQKLALANISYTDSIHLLPNETLQGKNKAVVSVSVANLRTQPAHAAELATQATLGTPLNVYKKEKGWYLVQTPDRYLAWVESGTIALMDSSNFATWQQGEKLLYTKPYGFSYSSNDKDGASVSDLVYGNVLRLQQQQGEFYKVSYPDGRTAFIPTEDAISYKDWVTSRTPTKDNLVQCAKKLMGVPYLWGGTSFKGVDCSGFTKTVYFMNGLVLPRDASQQVHIGEEINTKGGWQNLQEGDLLFFGVPAKDGRPERVIHVGMWIGGPNNEFIHASGMVRISSFNPQAANYDHYELNRFLRAKRIAPETALIDLRKNFIYQQ